MKISTPEPQPWKMQLTRQAFADALLTLGEEDERVVVLDADLSQSTLTSQFAKRFPERFYNMGIAEQDMVATASGMALMGLRPFVTSYAMFVAGRAWEIVRQQVSYGQAGVVVCGLHGGISVGKDGPTHQSMEDLALMRVLAGMSVVVPCDYWETYKTVLHAGRSNEPFYFRIGRETVPSITTEKSPFEVGKAACLADGKDGCIVACGLMVSQALAALDILAKRNVYPRLLNLHTIKPIDRETILLAARETGAILTVEEHSVNGGMGSAVAEVVVQSKSPVPMRIMGVKDRYLESGTPEELIELAGLTPDDIAINLLQLKEK